jgi:hypothetical protein
MLKLEDFFVYIDLLPILVVLFFFKKIKEMPIWVIFLYCAYSFANNKIILNFLNHKISVVNLLSFFTLFEYLLFAAILFLILKSPKFKKAILLISPSFAAICVYFIFWGSLKSFDSVQTAIECILIITFCLVYFYEQLVSPEVEFIYNSYKFWIIIALLLYLAGTFFIFVFAADMPLKERDSYWPILYVCGIVRNILFAIAVYLSTRPQDEEPYQSLI